MINAVEWFFPYFPYSLISLCSYYNMMQRLLTAAAVAQTAD